MKLAATLTPLTWGLLLSVPVMIAGGQILFKMSSQKLAASKGSFLTTLMFDPIFILALALYGLATLLWVYVLQTAPLTLSYTFMALSYVIVPPLAMVFLGESIDIKYVIGVGIILIGLMVVQS